MISDITGCTGDDVIALTAVADVAAPPRPSGALCSTHVMHNDWSRRERDIHDIIIRNVMATSYFCWIVRLLPVMSSIYNVVIDGIIDTKCAPDSPRAGTLLLGDGGGYGENLPDSMRNITISNVIGVGKIAVTVGGFLTDSVITNIVNRNPNRPAIHVARENGANNVAISNTVDAKRRS